MLRINHIFCLLGAVIISGILGTYLFSQEVIKPSRQAAFDSFSKGEFEKAYGEFTILLQNFPKDPLYKYYSGVCLVKLNRDPENASAMLMDAVNGSPEIRTIPDDAWFFLGRSRQMSGKFQDAIKSYDVFAGKAGRKAAHEMNVDVYVAECNAGEGSLNDSEKMFGDLLADTSVAKKPVNVTHVAIKQVDETPAVKQPVAVEPARPATVNRAAPAEKIPDKVIPSEKIPEDYDKRLSEAMDYQVKADSLKALASDCRKSYEELPSDQKQAVKTRIIQTEKLSARYQKLADALFGYPAEAETRDKNKAMIDSGTGQNLNKILSPAVPVPDTQAAKNDQNKRLAGQDQKVSAQLVGIFSVFNINPERETAGDQPVSIDLELPSGLIYRIQIGVYNVPLTTSYFRGVTPVVGFRIPGSSSVRYFAGLFRRVADAGKALLRVKQAGFRDAFLTASSDGKQISVDRATVLEKEWGLKPFLSVSRLPESISGISVTHTLIFRVEVTRCKTPLGDAATEAVKKIAGERSFEIFEGEDGSFVYLIGKFITFESASEYASLLNRNGYRDARVAGYLGNKEIPLEKARQLFEKAE